MSAPRPRRLHRLVLAVAVGVALVSACGGGTDDPATATSTPSRSSYPDVGSLAAALTDAGLPCTLEYEGLTDAGKQLSLCTIEDEQATLSIWFDPDQLDAFLASDDSGGIGATAVGANWTVDVGDVSTARRIADALGGTVKA